MGDFGGIIYQGDDGLWYVMEFPYPELGPFFTEDEAYDAWLDSISP